MVDFIKGLKYWNILFISILLSLVGSINPYKFGVFADVESFAIYQEMSIIGRKINYATRLIKGVVLMGSRVSGIILWFHWCFKNIDNYLDE